MKIFCVLKDWHPMLGVDMHIPWPLGSPTPAPTAVPYRTGAMLRWVTDLTVRYAPTTLSVEGYSMVRETDIGPGIPHVGVPSYLTPIDMLFSSSKSYFGTSETVVTDQTGSPGDLAVAVGCVVNLNWNCGTVAPLGIGVVLAPSSNVASMSLADFLKGLFQFALEFAIQLAINWLIGRWTSNRFGSISNWLKTRLGIGARSAMNRGALRELIREIRREFPRPRPSFSELKPLAEALRAADRAKSRVYDYTANAITAVSTSVISFFVGAPQGQSVSSYKNPDGSQRLMKSFYDQSMDKAKEYFNNPHVSEVPK